MTKFAITLAYVVYGGLFAFPTVKLDRLHGSEAFRVMNFHF